MKKEKEKEKEETNYWRIEKLGSIVTQLRMFEVCYNQPNIDLLPFILLHPNHSSKALLKTKTSSSSPSKSEEEEEEEEVKGRILKELNESQKEVIRKCMERKKGIMYIQGPPGTGKTTTIASLLALLSLTQHSNHHNEKDKEKNKNNKKKKKKKGIILVTAPSNKGVQTLMEKFLSLPNTHTVASIIIGVEDKLESNPSNPSNPINPSSTSTNVEIKRRYIHHFKVNVLHDLNLILNYLNAISNNNNNNNDNDNNNEVVETQKRTINKNRNTFKI